MSLSKVENLATIKLYEPEKYNEYLKENLSIDKKWDWIISILDKIDIKLNTPLIPIKINLKKLFIEKKAKEVAKYFLYPEKGLDDIAGIRSKFGIDEDISDGELAKKISDIYIDWILEHKSIEQWIRKKIALLEYMYRSPDLLSTKLLESFLYLRMNYNYIILCENDDPRSKVEEALQQALEAASMLTSDILNSSKSGCVYWANLMVPFDNKSDYYDYIFMNDISEREENTQMELNWNFAEQLWTPYRDINTTILGIVAETKLPSQSYIQSHIGFWVPIICSPQSNLPLPGAPHAYVMHEAHAVFRDDLPFEILDEFGIEFSQNWKTYILKNLKADLFVSIPFFTKQKEFGKPEVYAILNVNVRDSDKKYWRRACHKEWLKLVRDNVAPFICEAFSAYLINDMVSFEDEPE